MTDGAEAVPAAETVPSATARSTPVAEATLRLHAERLNVAREVRQTCVVRAASVTETREHEISEELAIETVDIVRVPIGRPVDACPPVRVEGDTTILSIVEEVLVVERRLVLKEEVHMTKLRTSTSHREVVTLREQHAVISRHPVNPSD